MISTHDVITCCGRFPERLGFATHEILLNAEKLRDGINLVFQAFGEDRHVNGFRPQWVTDEMIKAGKKAAKNSHHHKALAGDCEDDDRRLAMWCLKNPDTLRHWGLYIEEPEYTREKDEHGNWHAWVHFQTVPPRSGRTIFKPYDGPPPG